MRLAATILYVDDVHASVDFYCRAFGFTVAFFDRDLGFAELATGSTTLAIASHALGEMLMPGHYRPTESGGPGGVELGFLTPHVPSAFANVLQAGATEVAAPRKMPWGLEVAYLRAPDGTLIGFSEPPPGQSGETTAERSPSS